MASAAMPGPFAAPRNGRSAAKLGVFLTARSHGVVMGASSPRGRDVCAWNPQRVRRVIRKLSTSTCTVHVATDDGEAYVKTLGNPQGTSALASELIGTRLAAWLGLPTLEVAVVDFPDVGIEYSDGCRSEPGPAFATRAENGRAWSGEEDDLGMIENTEAISGLVVLDTWTRNCDRYRVRADEVRENISNVFLSEEGARRGRYRLLAMDHTECFRCGRELSPRLLHLDAVRDMTLYGLFPAFRPAVQAAAVEAYLERLRGFGAADAARVVDQLPREWAVSASMMAALRRFCVDRAQFLTTTLRRLVADQCEWNELNFDPGEVN